jgi:hypothetical protein
MNNSCIESRPTIMSPKESDLLADNVLETEPKQNDVANKVEERKLFSAKHIVG